MTVTDGRLLGRCGLLVVGAGPVGIAALWYARRYGIDAVAVDAAEHALQAVRDFSPGLVMASNAYEWEIDGLPVDCRIPGEITREDLLSYYARVRSYGELRVACRQRVVGVTPRDGDVRVDVLTNDDAGYWLADRVLITSWFRRRQLHIDGVEVRHAVNDVATLSGEDVVIFGAGLSGLEAADLLIRSGVRVSILSHGDRAVPADVASLLALSGSSLLSGVDGVSVSRPGFLRVVHGGGVTEVPCTVALNCTGQEINPATLDLLRPAGILDDAEIRKLESFRSASSFGKDSLGKLASELPVLSDGVWTGRQGVHFAGAIHHVGGVRAAGIVYSIETARWSVASIAGRPVTNAPEPTAHLPGWFVEHMNDRGILQRGPRWSEHFRRIVPLPVSTWSRGTRIFAWENTAGEQAAPVSRATRALGDGRAAHLTALRELCYAGVSVEDLLGRSGMTGEALVKALSTLWYMNGLTWVPPRRA